MKSHEELKEQLEKLSKVKDTEFTFEIASHGCNGIGKTARIKMKQRFFLDGIDMLRHHLEIRGIGVIDVQAIFGIRAIRMQKRVEVEVQLQEWDDDIDYERMGLENRYTEILGMSIPQVIVPLFPGKNITVISEVIALNFMLKVYGYDAAEVLNERILETMRTSDRLSKYLEQDLE